MHVTNAALPHNAKAGSHTLTVKVGDSEVALCTLEAGKCAQHSLDFVLDEPVIFKVYGPSASSVHIVGYQT